MKIDTKDNPTDSFIKEALMEKFVDALNFIRYSSTKKKTCSIRWRLSRRKTGRVRPGKGFGSGRPTKFSERVRLTLWG